MALGSEEFRWKMPDGNMRQDPPELVASAIIGIYMCTRKLSSQRQCRGQEPKQHRRCRVFGSGLIRRIYSCRSSGAFHPNLSWTRRTTTKTTTSQSESFEDDDDVDESVTMVTRLSDEDQGSPIKYL